MTKTRARIPIGLPIAIVVLLILGAIAGPVIRSNVSEQALAANVLWTAIPFILVFAAIVLTFISLIWLAASILNHNIPYRIYRPVELIAIAGIVLGLVGMFQPWSFILYRTGFLVLFIATLFFILWSHIVPKGARLSDELGSVSISEFEKKEATGAE